MADINSAVVDKKMWHQKNACKVPLHYEEGLRVRVNSSYISVNGSSAMSGDDGSTGVCGAGRG